MSEPQAMRQPPSSGRPLYVILGVVALLLCLCLLAAAIAGGFFYLRPQTATIEPSVEYVLDVSTRMELPAEGATGTRLEVARGVMAEILRPADPAVAAGLRVFGSGAELQPCQDTDLVVPLAPATQPQISQELLDLDHGPAPQSALAQAMVAAIRDLAATGGARSLVVVTGGQDSCQPEAGQLLAQEAERQGIELRTFVIGFQVAPAEAEAIKDMIAPLGNSQYLDAPDEAALADALAAIQAYLENPGSETLAAVETVAGPPLLPTPTAGEPAAALTATPLPEETEAAPAGTPSPATATEATATPALAASPAVPGADYTAQTACDHPYFPMRPGATWTFSGQSDGEPFTWTWTVSEVSGDLNNASATLVASFEGEFTITYHWTCGPEGIVSYDFGNFNLSGLDFEGGSIDFEVTSGSGVFLPPLPRLVTGASWNRDYVMVSTFAAEGFSFSSTSDVSESYTVAGFEDVRTAAGQFPDALRVNSNNSYAITIDIAGGTTTTMTGTSSQWYALGVGWVRAEQIDDEGFTSSWELVSYRVP